MMATASPQLASPIDMSGPVDEMAPDEWQQGWWQQARRQPSPNFGPRPSDSLVDLIVVHSISLPPGQYGGRYIEQLFTNQLDWDAHPYFDSIRGMEVSAHFLIRRDGEVIQFVSVADRAWHAGKSTWLGRPNCNDYSVGIELEGLEGEHFETPQYDKLTLLLQALARHLPVKAVVGHEHVAPDRKRDPGAQFDWGALTQRLDWDPQRIGAAAC